MHAQKVAVDENATERKQLNGPPRVLLKWLCHSMKKRSDIRQLSEK
ncbi:hypothetical protein [Companilactobacillus mishanensis]|nr:hypothetical protein [Companilactobacillus mishanensis]